MIHKFLIAILILFFIFAFQARESASVEKVYSSKERVLAEQKMSLENRYANKFVNDVFKDNILLTFAYLSGQVTDPAKIDWDEVRKPSRSEVVLQPGEVFAYHDDVLPEFKGKVVKTTNANFGPADGFKTDGFLYGDGVCHFASLINWAARDAGLKVVAPTNHNFANIPEVPMQYGTSIYTTPGENSVDQMQNLYVENTFDKPVRMVFDYSENTMKVTIYE